MRPLLLCAGLVVAAAMAACGGSSADDDAQRAAATVPAGTARTSSEGASFALPSGWSTQPRTSGAGIIARGPAGTGGLAPTIILARNAGAISAQDAADLNVVQAKSQYPGVQVEGPREATVAGADDARAMTYRFSAKGGPNGVAVVTPPGAAGSVPIVQRVLMTTTGDVQRSFTVQIAQADVTKLPIDGILASLRVDG